MPAIFVGSLLLQVLFLQNRLHFPNVAILFAAGGTGWIFAWSVHPQGGLLGQFIAAHKQGDVVLAMATDQLNTYLFTGDSSGYIKVRNGINSVYRQALLIDIMKY